MRRLLSLVTAVIILATTISCSSDNSKELSMYILDYDTVTKSAIDKFNEAHKDVQIKAKSLASVTEVQSKLMYEFNNGKDADIILCDGDTLPNLSVFFNKGSFYDLNTLIDNDKSFKKSDYFENVLDYGVFKYKRYVIPLSFKIEAMFTTKEILEKSNVEIDGKNTGLDAFSEAADKYMSAVNEQDKYFVSGLDLNSLIQTSEKSFIDLENNTASFDTQDFIDLLNKYKSVSGSVCPSVMTATSKDRNNILPESKAVFLKFNALGPRYITEPYRSFGAEIDPVMISSPSGYKGTHTIAVPERYIGVNSKCGNLNAAYDFVKLLLSKEYQDIDTMGGIPVNRDAYEQEKEYCLKGKKGYDAWQAGGCKNKNTLKKLYSQLDTLIENIDRCWTSDTYINIVVQDKIQDFMDGNVKAEDAAKSIQQEIQNYLKSGVMNPSWYEKKAELDKPKTGKEIKIYYAFYQEYIKNAIDLYSKKYQSEDIIGELQTMTPPEVMLKTETELMAGAGPGLILFKSRFFNSISKAVSSGAFHSLDDFEKNNNEYKAVDYYQNILNEGVFNGKRYYYPIFYNYKPFETTKEALERNSIKIDYSNWTWSQLDEIVKKFSKEHKDSYFFDTYLTFKEMVRNSGLKPVDFDNKTCNFSTPEFKDLMRIYKDFYPLILPEAKSESVVNMMKHRSCVLASAFNFTNPPQLRVEFDSLQDQVGENLVIVPFPSYSGKKHLYFMTDDCIGINSRCKNKEAAYNFVKILLSEDVQSGVNNNGYSVAGTTTPVSKKGYKLSFDNWLHSSIGKIPDDIVYFADNNVYKLECPPIVDSAIYNIINEVMNSYIDGKKTVDQAAKEIDDKVSIFLNE